MQLIVPLVWFILIIFSNQTAAAPIKVLNHYYSDQEIQMAKQMMQQINLSGKLYSDPLVTEYIQSIGNRLNHSSHSEKPLSFFVLHDDRINAFAGPAGYIGINSGLILETETESELASILAHEIAHINQGHLKQNLDAANRMGVNHAATVLAAIALGIIDPSLATSALTLGKAWSAQQQLNFSREHEFEADQIGMKLLTHAAYNPESMLDFFGRLSQQERYYDRPPELLLTHPFTEERIAQASNRLAHIQSHKAQDSPNFGLLRERIRVTTSSKRDSPIKCVNHQ